MEDRKIVELYFQRAESAIDQTQEKYGKYCGDSLSEEIALKDAINRFLASLPNKYRRIFLNATGIFIRYWDYFI